MVEASSLWGHAGAFVIRLDLHAIDGEFGMLRVGFARGARDIARSDAEWLPDMTRRGLGSGAEQFRRNEDAERNAIKQARATPSRSA